MFDAKRLIGRKVDDPEIKKDMKHWPFKIVEKNSRPHIRVNHKGGNKDFVRIYPMTQNTCSDQEPTDS